MDRKPPFFAVCWFYKRKPAGLIRLRTFLSSVISPAAIVAAAAAAEIARQRQQAGIETNIIATHPCCAVRLALRLIPGIAVLTLLIEILIDEIMRFHAIGLFRMIFCRDIIAEAAVGQGAVIVPGRCFLFDPF